MFSRRVFGGNPDSFKLILEYGRDSLETSAQPGGAVRLPVALATLEFEFNSDENEATILERFTQAKSRIAFDRLEERVVLKLSPHGDQQTGIKAKLSIACITPALRCVQVARTSSTGNAPEALLTALFKHCDLTGVWKLRGADGFSNFWCSCCEVRSWRSLANMNLSSCGLTALPPAVGALETLRILRLSHNRLTALPQEVSALTALEVLAADHNQLTAIPAELRRCSSLRHLELEGNKLVTPVLDLRALSSLVSLQLYGNPLEYLPELSPASALRSLSLANVRIMADAAYSRWEVEVAALPYISRGHKLAPLFKLTFRRSSCQHPLLAGALGRISEDRGNCELMAREETAIQQLVLMALSEQPVVGEQACRTLEALAQLGLSTARRLLAHDVVSTILTLLRSPRQVSKLCGLNLLSSLAAGSEAVSAELLTPELLALLHACVQAASPETRVAALSALANLAFCRDNKLKIRAAAGLLSTLVDLATAPSAPIATAAPAASAAAAAAAAFGSAGGERDYPIVLRTSPTGPKSQAGLWAADGEGQRPGAEGLGPVSAPTVERMPSRGVAGQRYSDTGVGSVVGSPPGPGAQMAPGLGFATPPPSSGAVHSVSAGGTTAGHASAATPSPGYAAEVLSPPQQQLQAFRGLHHSSSTPSTVSMASGGIGSAGAGAGGAGGGGGGGGGSISGGGGGAASAPSTQSPARAASSGSAVPGGLMSPTSPTVDPGAPASSLPPQISLAPPREVPEPVATRDQARLLAIKVLAILGENEHVRRAVGQPPIVGRGIRVLTLDGGGMRGLALVQIMRHIERRAGRPLHQLFDLVVGTSTGAIVAFGLGLFHYTLDQCEAIYTGLGHKVFNQAGSTSSATPREELVAAAQAQAAAQAASSAAAAMTTSSASSSGWRDSLFRVVKGTSTNLRVAVYGFKHDASTFEDLLKQMCDVKKLGCVANQLIDAAALGGPKVAAVATLVSCCPVTPFLFTSYELPPEVAPAAAAIRACPSSCKLQLWQAVRASSAAPYYLDDFVCGDERYQDGAATANNPSILALQQARLLWPGVPLQALVSVGCGAAPSVRRERGAHAVLDTGAVLVDAATSPDRADEALSTLLPLVPGVRYFRFQPVHECCSMELDDVNPQHWAALQAAVDEYCTAHSARIDELAELLLSGQPPGPVGGAGAAGGTDGPGVEEEAFETPAGVGPDGRPLPPVPRVRLPASRRGVVLVEARPVASHRSCHPAGAAAAATDTAPGSLHSPDGSLLAPDQAVLEALAARLHTLRRCDLAATAADMALSAKLVAEHMRRLQEQEQEQQQQRLESLGHGLRLGPGSEPGAGVVADAGMEPRESARPTGVVVVQSDTATPASPGAEAHNVPHAAAASAAAESMSAAAAETAASGGGAGSPPKGPQGVCSPRTSSARPWATGSGGRPSASNGGWMTYGGAGSSGPEAPVAAAASAAVADAAAEAAEAAASGGGGTGSGTPPASSSLYEYFFGSGAASAARRSSNSNIGTPGTGAVGTTAGTTTGGAASSRGPPLAPATPQAAAAVPAAGAAAAATPATTTDVKAGAPVAAAPPSVPMLLRTEGSSFSLSIRSPPSAISDGTAPTPTAQAPGGGPSCVTSPAAVSGGAGNPPAGLLGTRPGARSAPAEGPAGGGGGGGGGGGDELVHLQPAALLGALLQDLGQRAGVLHLGLQVVRGGGGSVDRGGGVGGRGEEEGCGLVASWRQEVVAVVEPGPDADRILAELGHPLGPASPSLSSLFAAARGSPLESPRCVTYSLLARQEVWHQSAPLATLLLQVSRPASLLRPQDLARMAPQMGGLVVTSAAPLPPAVTMALLRSGAAAVVCPHGPLPAAVVCPHGPLPAAVVCPHGPLPAAVVCPHGPLPAHTPLSRDPAGLSGDVAVVASAPTALPLPATLVLPTRQHQQHEQQPLQLQLQAGSAPRQLSSASEAVVGFFGVLVDELVAGATVLGAISAAERQFEAMTGRVVFHHL